MIRLQDVATLAKVSLFSASKVLNGTWSEARISAKCASRVQQAARELGYTPNYHAQSLSKGRSQTIGLVLREPRFTDPDFSSVLMTGIESQLAAHHHDLLIVGRRGEGDETEIQHGIQCLLQQRVDALIVPGALGDMIWNDEFESAKGVIILAGAKHNSVHPAVDVDPVSGIHEAVRHLFNLGHRDILWYSPDANSGGAQVETRRTAFHEATVTLGIRAAHETFETPGHLRQSSEFTTRSRKHFAGLLDQGLQHSAIMCFNDATAIGVCQAAHDRRIHVPQDFSVIGFDDFHSEMTIPRLTTISHELASIGARAAELAIAMVKDGTIHERLRGQIETIPARLVVRESTAAPSRRIPR
jgi:LacI family transcriptional regulator